MVFIKKAAAKKTAILYGNGEGQNGRKEKNRSAGFKTKKTYGGKMVHMGFRRRFFNRLCRGAV